MGSPSRENPCRNAERRSNRGGYAGLGRFARSSASGATWCGGSARDRWRMSTETRPVAVDERAPGGTPLALPQRVAARRAVGAERFALAGLAGFFAIFGAVKAKRTEAIDLAITIRWQRVRHPII